MGPSNQPGTFASIQSKTARSKRRLSPSTTSSVISAKAHTTKIEAASAIVSQTTAATVSRSAITRRSSSQSHRSLPIQVLSTERF